jgi:ABC-type multidrug transport system ATPase subunit
LHPIRDRREFQTLTGFLAAGDRGLYGRLTLRQHLDLWGKISMLSKKEIREGIDRLVPALGLEDFLDRRANRMSMGQRQRLRLSMVFLHEPTFVLLDEPLNSLDNVGGELLAVQLAELTARGGAAIWCSPGTDAPPVTFDRRLRLEAGHLVEV